MIANDQCMFFAWLREQNIQFKNQMDGSMFAESYNQQQRNQENREKTRALPIILIVSESAYNSTCIITPTN